MRSCSPPFCRRRQLLASSLVSRVCECACIGNGLWLYEMSKPLQCHASFSSSTHPRSSQMEPTCGDQVFRVLRHVLGHLTQTTILPNTRAFFLKCLQVFCLTYISAHRGQKRLLDPLGLELKAVISCHVCWELNLYLLEDQRGPLTTPALRVLNFKHTPPHLDF